MDISGAWGCGDEGFTNGDGLGRSDVGEHHGGGYSYTSGYGDGDGYNSRNGAGGGDPLDRNGEGYVRDMELIRTDPEPDNLRQLVTNTVAFAHLWRP